MTCPFASLPICFVVTGCHGFPSEQVIFSKIHHSHRNASSKFGSSARFETNGSKPRRCAINSSASILVSAKDTVHISFDQITAHMTLTFFNLHQIDRDGRDLIAPSIRKSDHPLTVRSWNKTRRNHASKSIGRRNRKTRERSNDRERAHDNHQHIKLFQSVDIIPPISWPFLRCSQLMHLCQPG